MNRSVKVSLELATAKKLRRLNSVVTRLRKMTNRFIAYIWNHKGSFDDLNYKDVFSKGLTHSHIQSCFRQAQDIVSKARKVAKATGREVKQPKLRRSVRLGPGLANVRQGRRGFDYVLTIATLDPYHRLIIPFKSHKKLNYWLSLPGAQLRSGCIIQGTNAVLCIRLPDLPERKNGAELGIDIGYKKLMVDSEGECHGIDISQICETIRHKKPGSKGCQRARTTRNHYINHTLKQLPWGKLKLLVMEDLNNLKRGKQKKRSKAFRKKMAPWTYRQVLSRASQLAEENRVCLQLVDPKNTSKRCPHCVTVSNENRKGEKFLCIVCGYNADADFVGAQNIIAKTFGNYQECIVPDSKKAKANFADQTKTIRGLVDRITSLTKILSN